nr:peroxide stress protein YaaA [Streptomyces spiramenti]
MVLLPPSEGKADGRDGPPLDFSRLALPSLNPARESVLAELTELCAADTGKAREILGLSERQNGEVAKNTGLRTAPTLPAGSLYTGVLYDALGLATLNAAAAARAERNLLVFSGLWGALRVTDPVPSYRCSGGVRLPALGALARHWREPLTTAMPAEAEGRLVLDLRSTAYAGMWKPDRATASRTTTVRVLQSRIVDGVEKRSVVSHFNKATKGRVVRALLEAGAEPETPAQLAAALRDLGHRVESTAPSRLDIVVTEV